MVRSGASVRTSEQRDTSREGTHEPMEGRTGRQMHDALHAEAVEEGRDRVKAEGSRDLCQELVQPRYGLPWAPKLLLAHVFRWHQRLHSHTVLEGGRAKKTFCSRSQCAATSNSRRATDQIQPFCQTLVFYCIAWTVKLWSVGKSPARLTHRQRAAGRE